jgi:phosphate/sulfate permease
MGFSAEASGGAVLMASSYYGFPLSTTHIVSGSILLPAAAIGLFVVAQRRPVSPADV